MRLAINIIRKDWREYGGTVLLLTSPMLLQLFFSNRQSEFFKGLAMGVVVVASFGYAYFCFSAERLRRTLDLLLGLPVRPFDLVLAKYASVYSMILFTANIPGLFLNSARDIFLINAAALFFATVCMASAVISPSQVAGFLPLWIALIFLMPGQETLKAGFNSHIELIAALALALTPLIALASAFLFQRKAFA